MNQRRKFNLAVCFIVAVTFLLSAAVSYGAVADKVLVVVDDEVLTQREFERAFAAVKRAIEAKFSGEERNKQLAAARKSLLDQMVNSKLAVSLAKKADLEVDEAMLNSRIDMLKSQYKDEDAFLQDLDTKGTTLTELKKDIRDQMLAQQVIETEVAGKIAIPPSEIKELYEKNKKKLISPARVKVRGILVRKGADAGKQMDTAKAQASVAEGMKEDYVAGVLNRSVMKKSIEELYQEIKGGKDFATIAEQFSEGPYAKRGGDMGYLAPGQVLGEIDEVIFSLKKGEVSEIVETPIGYHVFKVEDVQSAKPLTFEEVSDYLKEQLYMKKFETELANWLEKKKKNAYIAYK